MRFENALPLHVYQYCEESLRLDGAEMFTVHRKVPSVHDKALQAMCSSASLGGPNFHSRRNLRYLNLLCLA